MSYVLGKLVINILVFKALTSGTNLHLTENELLRGVFEMGAPIPSLSSVQGNISKHQRVRFNKLQCLYDYYTLIGQK